MRVKGAWKYLCRAVDKAGATVDFLLTARRDQARCVSCARLLVAHGAPQKITIDKSGANTAAIVGSIRPPLWICKLSVFRCNLAGRPNLKCVTDFICVPRFVVNCS